MLFYLLVVVFLMTHVSAQRQCSTNEMNIDAVDSDTGERKAIAIMTDDGPSPSKSRIRKFLSRQYKIQVKIKNFLRQHLGKAYKIVTSAVETVSSAKQLIQAEGGVAGAAVAVAKMKSQKFFRRFDKASAVFDAIFFPLQAIGLHDTIQAFLAVGPNGTSSFDATSVNGVLTILSTPGQIFGAFASPFLIYDALHDASWTKTVHAVDKWLNKKLSPKAYNRVTKFARFIREGVSDMKSTLSGWKADAFAKIKNAKIFNGKKFLKFSSRVQVRLGKIGAGIRSIAKSIRSGAATLLYKCIDPATIQTVIKGAKDALQKVTSAVTTISTGFLVPLAIFDFITSIFGVSDAAAARAANADPAYDAYFTYVYLMSIGRSLFSAAGLIASLFVIASVHPVAATVVLFVIGIINVIMLLFDESSARRLRAERASTLRRYKEMQVAPCESVTTEFFRYLVKIAHEMEYLASRSSNVRNSSIFDLSRLSADSDVNNPYVHLAKIVIEEKRVIPTLSPIFVRQLRHRNRNAVIDSQARTVSIEKLVLPSNMFLSVGSHECAPIGDDIGLCNAASFRRVLITRVKFLDIIDLSGGMDDAGGGAPDPTCRFWVRGRPKSDELARLNNRNPDWRTQIYLELEMQGDGYLEAFDFECWDDDGFGTDDMIGKAHIRLDTARNVMVHRFDNEKQYLVDPVNIKFTYEVHGMHETPYEWIPVPLNALRRCRRIVRDSLHVGVSFVSCEFRCDARPDCNARRYSHITRKCELYRCRASSSLELEGVEDADVVAYVRLESVNCGGYYARSCKDCDNHCFGQCRKDGGNCVKRTCGKCVFPFVEGRKTYWGCTSQSASYHGELKCATKVDRNWNALAWADCDKKKSQCKQLCATYHCSSGWVQVPNKECDGDCTDSQCCHTTNRRALRQISKDQSSLYGASPSTTRMELNRWKSAGEDLLFVDKECIGSSFGGHANNETLIRSRVHLAETGHSSIRKLKVVVNKDSLVLESNNIFLPTMRTAFYELTPLRLHYSIELNGRKGMNKTEHVAIEGKSLDPLRYTLIIPGFDFGRDTPTERSSSYSYTLHKTSLRDTIVTVVFSAYAPARRAGYSWKGKFGLFQSCIEQFAKPLHLMKPKWQMRMMSSLPARSVVRYRTIQMGTRVNDKILFFVRRSTHSCRINHADKTYMLEAIEAYRPTEQEWWQNRERYYKYNSPRMSKLREIKFNHTMYLTSILETLEEYRNSEVAGFKREERPVQVLLSKARDATFYFNAISGDRPWVVFVPRVQPQQLHMDFQIDSLDDTLFKSQQMHSFNILPGVINVTYVFPSLGHSSVRQSVGLVTIFLRLSQEPKLVKVVCPMCTVKAVMDQIDLHDADETVDKQEVQIVHTHHHMNGSVVPRDVSWILYATPKMREHRYFPYDAREFQPIGYFDSVKGGCVLVRKTAQSDTFTLYRASPVSSGDAPARMVRLRIPRSLVRGNTSPDRLQDITRSNNPQCEGVIAQSMDFTLYCVTCDLVTILESHNHRFIPSDNVSAHLPNGGNDPYVPALKDAPRFAFFSEEKAKAEGYQGVAQYRHWTFRLPNGFLDESSVSTPRRPWSADVSQSRHYFFEGIVRVDPIGEGRVFVLWTSGNIEDDIPSVICDHDRLGRGKCTKVEDDFETMESTKEARIVESGVGTWVLQQGKDGDSNEFKVDRVLADELKGKSARFPTLLFQRSGTSKYGYRGCEFDLAGAVSLLSRGATRFSARDAPLGFLLTEADKVTELRRDCSVSSTNIQLDESMKSHSWIVEALHIVVARPSSGTMKIPRVPGYSDLSISFTNVPQDISIALGPEWAEDMGPQDVVLYVEERVTLVHVRYQGRDIQLNDKAHQLNAQVSVEVERLPDVVHSDGPREKNIEEADTHLIYRAYQMTSASRMRRGSCDGCSGQDICLPSGSCVERADLFSRLLPVWREQRVSARMPSDMYCLNQRYVQRCANLRDFYTYLARLLNNGTRGNMRDGDRLQTNFGSIMLCSTNACFADAVESKLKSHANATSFVLKLVTVSATSARMALWPDLKRSSSRGVGGAALMEISRGDPCNRLQSTPARAKNIANNDPDGFGRLVEQIYFEATLNGGSANLRDHACVRVSSAYAALATQEYQTPGDSADHLRRVARKQQLSCGASLEVSTESTSRGKSLLAADFGEAGVDMRVSSVFTVIESLITLVDVAKKHGWNLSGLKQRDLLWSLLKDGDFLYFEQFGGITLKNWPDDVNQHGGVGAWDGGFDTNGPVLGPLLKRLLNVLPQHSAKSRNQPSSAMGSLHEWSKIVEIDFTSRSSMQNSMTSWQNLKVDFPNIEKCTTPIDPKFSARRYICNKYGASSTYTLVSVRQSRVGRFLLGASTESRIDDSCDAYSVNLTICFGTDQNATGIEVRYSGVDWVPEVKEYALRMKCRPSAAQNIPVAPKLLWNSAFHSGGKIGNAAYRPENVRVRVKDIRYLCAMRESRDFHIRAVQRYDVFPDLSAEGYIGSSNPRYRLRQNKKSGRWGLYYRSTNSDVVLMQWKGTRVNEMVGASGPFVVEDPFYETHFEADVVLSGTCIGDVALPSVVPSEINPTAHAVPLPSYHSCDDFVNVAQSFTCDVRSRLLQWARHIPAAECESECMKSDQCKYYTQYSDSCQLWATCSKMERVDDANVKIFARTSKGRDGRCWKTVLRCDSQSTQGELPLGIWRVRICSKESECVESKEPKRLHALQDANKSQCDLKCVMREWNGPAHLLKRLTRTCYPNKKYVYHACGNHDGLHVELGRRCTWKRRATESVEFQIDAAEKACKYPKNTIGYDLSSITSQDLRIATFNVQGIKCKDGYAGKPIAEACNSVGGEYTIQGCKETCIPPKKTIGYDLSRITSQDLRIGTFGVQGIKCKSSYEGTPFARVCNSLGGEYTLHDCKPKDFWPLAFKCGDLSVSSELLSFAEEVSICSKGTKHCVYSKTDVPLDNLRFLGSLHDHADFTCNINCVRKNWWATARNQRYLKYLTDYCRQRELYYGACDTSGKLHMALGKTGSLWPQYFRGTTCTWSLGHHMPVEMRFRLPPAVYSAMKDRCGPSHKVRLGKFDDVQGCANRCMISPGCSNFIFGVRSKVGECYRTEKCTKETAFDSYRIDLPCATIKTLDLCVSSVDTRPMYAGSRCAWCCGKKCPSGHRCEAEKYLVSTAVRYHGFITSESNSCSGPSESRYELLQKNRECESGNILLLPKTNVYKCAMHCSVSPGCKYFIFGQSGAEKNKCYRETTEGPRCLEGWRSANYNFYMLTRSDSPYSTLKKGQWCDAHHVLLSGEVASAQKCANLCREDHKCRYFVFGDRKCYQEQIEGFCNKWKKNNAYTLYMLGDRASSIGGNNYRCTYTKHVITADKICNEQNECGDFSDEASCIDGRWGGWGSCSKTVDGTQYRRCNGPDARYARKACQGLRSRPCNQVVRCSVVEFSNMKITGDSINIKGGQDDPWGGTVDPYMAFYSEVSTGTLKSAWTRYVGNNGNPHWNGNFFVETYGKPLTLLCADSDDDWDDYLGHHNFRPESFTSKHEVVKGFGHDNNYYGSLPDSIKRYHDGGTLYYSNTKLEFDYKCYGNKLYNTEASWGGRCQCPDGSVHSVSDKGDSCKSLSCTGGRMLDCNKKSGKWSYQGVTCLSPNRVFKMTAGWGGTCRCPDGTEYGVSDENNACGSLACHGGTRVNCNRRQGSWSFRGVKCAVSCGKHYALSCAKCRYTPDGKDKRSSWCNGNCRWRRYRCVRR